jgi:hypothetical protein
VTKKKVLKNHAGLQTLEQTENSLKDLFKHPQFSPLLIRQKFGDAGDDDDRSVRFNVGEYSCNGKTNINLSLIFVGAYLVEWSCVMCSTRVGSSLAEQIFATTNDLAFPTV